MKGRLLPPQGQQPAIGVKNQMTQLSGGRDLPCDRLEGKGLAVDGPGPAGLPDAFGPVPRSQQAVNINPGNARQHQGDGLGSQKTGGPLGIIVTRSA